MKPGLAYYPKHSLSPLARGYCYSLAAIIIVMAIMQLMTFEKFIPVMQNYRVFDNPGMGKVLASSIVAVEVLSLPFLLRLRLSPLMRWLSASLLAATGILWVSLGAWALLTQPPLIGSGLTGSLLSHLPLWLSLTIEGGLCLLTLGAVYILRRDLKK